MNHGVIEWFDATGGYGFVITDDYKGVYFRVLNRKQNTDSAFSEGQHVELRARRTDRGLEATFIKVVKPPAETGENESPRPQGPPTNRGNLGKIGKYEIIRTLGQGGMGVVYLARNGDGLEFALKQVRPDRAWDHEFLKRFAKEARNASRVRSRYTAKVIEAVIDVASYPYLVTEFIDGPTLGDRVSQRGPLSPSEAKVVAIGTAAALHAIHRADLVHRDLKPSNVMLSQSGPRVIDFGIALSLDDASRITRTGALLGAPAYMSPEQISGSPLTPASDIFSWASVIILAFTGHHPFESPTGNINTLRRLIMSERPNLAGIPNDFRKILGSCLNKDPTKRPSARNLLALLTGESSTIDLNEERITLNSIILNPGTGVIDARDRSALLGRLARERFDVLVIGGGITGSGAALDAASRGLRVALVEARDLASGTSSRSSKLVDGGLRYLEQFDFTVVYQAARERDLLVSKLAPHLVKPVSFMYPLYKKVVERPYVGAGLILYDSMNSHRQLPRHKHLTARGALKRAPVLSPERLAGAMLYYDAQVDDARHTLTVARTAAAHNAVIATRVSATGIRRDDRATRVTGARVRDEETGREIDVTADSVIVCAGVWTDLVHELAGVKAGYRVRMSKGVHIVVPRTAVDANTGMILHTEKSVLFFIPWGDHWIVGTTDTDWSGDRAEPAPSEDDVEYILTAANRVLARPLTRADVIRVYAGLRPLVAGDNVSMSTTQLSRGHVIDMPLPGLVSIVGGRFTTYRLMARDVLDAAVADFVYQVPESVTHHVLLLGAAGFTAMQPKASELAEDNGVTRATVEHLLGRYGTLAEDVLSLIRADITLTQPLAEGHPYLRAEVAYAVSHENALHVEDVLMRRTRLFIEAADGGAGAAADVAAIMGQLLGWSRRRRAAEVRRYLELIEAERVVLPTLDSTR